MSVSITNNRITFGCDPEFFFKKDGKIIGSEHILDGKQLSKDVGRYGEIGTFVIDGVQAELNIPPDTCRARSLNHIAQSFHSFKRFGYTKGVELCFDPCVSITAAELAKLDPKNQRFGCMPSLSISTTPPPVDLIEVNPLEYRYRSAGGHLHLGFPEVRGWVTNGQSEKVQELVRLLDLIVGNTCVLIDRDKGNKERRKLYGRAGEFRLPKHGIEYRTLSNFWLRSARLYSLVTGLSRFAIALTLPPYDETGLKEKFLSAVPQRSVERAINSNSFVLARRNYLKIRPLLIAYLPDKYSDYFGIHRDNLKNFEDFFEAVNEYGLECVLPETKDPLHHWCTLPEGHKEEVSVKEFLDHFRLENINEKTPTKRGTKTTEKPQH